MNAGFSDSARRLYESARLDRPAWLPWTRLSAKVRDTWGEAVYLAALEAAHAPSKPSPDPGARAGAENGAGGRTGRFPETPGVPFGPPSVPPTAKAASTLRPTERAHLPPPPDAALRAALADGG